MADISVRHLLPPRQNGSSTPGLTTAKHGHLPLTFSSKPADYWKSDEFFLLVPKVLTSPWIRSVLSVSVVAFEQAYVQVLGSLRWCCRAAKIKYMSNIDTGNVRRRRQQQSASKIGSSAIKTQFVVESNT